jgi:hypothetical protein
MKLFCHLETIKVISKVFQQLVFIVVIKTHSRFHESVPVIGKFYFGIDIEIFLAEPIDAFH